MSDFSSIFRRDGCVSCPSPLPCTCNNETEDCVRTASDCVTCPVNKCVPKPNIPSKPSSGVSKGALAGGVMGAILFLALAIALFLRYRKKHLVRKTLAQREVKDIPAPASTVLNRPDPIEKSPTELSASQETNAATIDTGSHPYSASSYPSSGLPPPMNPFDDANSIQTAVTEGTNVIPIALVSPDSHRVSMSSSGSSDPSTTSSGPTRPPRSPDLNLNLDHVNVSHDNLRRGAPSTRSGVSGISRNSYMSSASYASEFLNEAPMIMTPTKGSVRQVIGVTKAEVINASAASSDSLKPPPAYGRQTARSSPLAASSFGPDDSLKESDERDPFADENISNHASYAQSPSPSASTFGARESQGNWSSEASALPPSVLALRGNQSTPSRPSSLSTQAGSVIDIASATRVNVGLKSPGSANSFRTTMGRLVTPEGGNTFQDQQHRALAHAQAQAHAQGLDARRVSGSSAISAVSNTADSILESFPFVPPSPISDRPIRSPPVSPLGKQSFTSSTPLNQHTFIVAPPSPLNGQSFNAQPTKMSFGPGSKDEELPAPPNRRTLGMSTGSQLSTASSGLGSFPFQIDSEPTADHPPPTAYNGRQRASLDTLALTNDLSSYPLGFDRDSVQPPKK
ncbi:hypothetical protein CPB83DRAFT_756547 [Crepidotus variabilis]|uniref:Membrane anchor Opy2 N-terminal domain-containing protein n=1 Tax=Crepidotus variabilis TaxID=179855 RepID=A0A9P6ETG9_9AGAR|nr:hypothetical protein CPB83DRAFT_756547 [Crepidotus variabilis]